MLSGSNGVSKIYTVKGKDGSTATVHSQGAHVTSWKTNKGKERLFLSPSCIYKDGVALRGGVPIIFPQFSDYGNSKKTHGVARNNQWTLSSVNSDGGATFKFELREERYREEQGSSSSSIDGTGVTPCFPGINIDLYFEVCVSNEELQLRAHMVNVEKCNEKKTIVPSSIQPVQFAFHTYFAVSDIENIEISGFEQHPYSDNLKNRQMIHPPKNKNIITTSQNDDNEYKELTKINQEIDRVYYNLVKPIVIVDKGLQQKLTITGVNLPDVVVWNPWEERGSKLIDLPQPDGYKHYICVEHATINPGIPMPSIPGNDGPMYSVAQIIRAETVSKL
eukprot:Tbor_TRINITY_DN3277_c0_g1::TRINITY_DN3277_c0_g1_i1::g.23677::m.23677/K01792/E5.1.3.15; glucose-6-phosphate 1-epimerase